MPTIPNRFHFQPDRNALAAWLATRKANLQIGTVSIPGFYADHKFTDDQAWYFGAVSGELVGAFLTVLGGIRKGGPFLIGAVILVLMFVSCDIFFAIKLHRNAAKKCYLRNQLYLTGDADPQFRRNLEIQYEDGQLVDFVLKIAIVLIALIKLAAIVLLGIFNNLLAYAPIGVLYLFVSYVHIYHTGYWWAYWRTARMFNHQYKMYGKNNGQHVALSLQHPFLSGFKLKNMPIKVGDIAIVEDKEPTTGHHPDNQYAYVIQTKGVLLDDDIHLLMSGQEAQQKQLIAYECRRHQLENMSGGLTERIH